MKRDESDYDLTVLFNFEAAYEERLKFLRKTLCFCRLAENVLVASITGIV